MHALNAARIRPVGRIDERAELSVDHDGCAGTDWLAVLRSGKLGDVTGAFALAWRHDGKVLLARDGVGERTLYYAVTPTGVRYAASIRELLAAGVERRLDPLAVANYLTYAYLPGARTLVEGIREVLPGQSLIFDGSAVQESSFWSIPPEPAEYVEPETDLVARLRAALEIAVAERLPTGEEVGAFLSGGLDSSLVVALARKLHPHPVRTWSVAFGPEYPNELAFSSMLAEHCGTLHQVVELSPAMVLRHLDDTIGCLSDPIGDPLTVPNALLFREAAQHVGVVLNGEGGDPCFGGPKNLPMVLSELYGEPGEWGREEGYLRAHLKCYDELREMLTPEYADAIRDRAMERELRPMFDDPRWRKFVTKLQMVNVRLKGGHHILPKVDALSAPFGVLPRSPLFDRRVVELSFAIPPQGKLRGSVEKYLLKQSVLDVVPDAIIRRPKSGMMVPVEGWFTGPLLPAARERLLDGLTPYGIFRREYLEKLLGGTLGGSRPRHGVKVWLLVTLEAWLRRVFRS